LLIMQAVMARVRMKLFPVLEKVMLVLVIRIANEAMIAFHGC
jgi:hypothetical protein